MAAILLKILNNNILIINNNRVLFYQNNWIKVKSNIKN